MLSEQQFGQFTRPQMVEAMHAADVEKGWVFQGPVKPVEDMDLSGFPPGRLMTEEKTLNFRTAGGGHTTQIRGGRRMQGGGA